jgi:hypothetical protein
MTWPLSESVKFRDYKRNETYVGATPPLLNLFFLTVTKSGCERRGAGNAIQTGKPRLTEQVSSLGCHGNARQPYPQGGCRCRWGVAQTPWDPWGPRRKPRVRSRPRKRLTQRPSLTTSERYGLKRLRHIDASDQQIRLLMLHPTYISIPAESKEPRIA